MAATDLGAFRGGDAGSDRAAHDADAVGPGLRLD